MKRLINPSMFCLAWLLLIAGNALTVLGYETGKVAWFLVAAVFSGVALTVWTQFQYLLKCAREDAINKGALNATGRMTESKPEGSQIK